MTIQLKEEHDGKILEVRVSGRLARRDYQRFVPEFGRLVQQHGKIRVLFEMANFRGWERAALWDDIKFDLKHFAASNGWQWSARKEWQKGMSAFCRPFTTARIRYFDRTDWSAAHAWLVDESDSAEVAQAPVLRVFQSRDQTKAYYNKISRFYDALSDRSEAPVRKAGLDLLKSSRRGKDSGNRLWHRPHPGGFGQSRRAPRALYSASICRTKWFGWPKKNLAAAGLLERVRLALRRRNTTSVCGGHHGCGVHEFHAGTF